MYLHHTGSAAPHATTEPESGNAHIIRNQRHQRQIFLFPGLDLIFFISVDQCEENFAFWFFFQIDKGLTIICIDGSV